MQIILSTVASVLMAFLISKYAFKNGSFDCEHYILSVYLYVAISVSLVALTIGGIEKLDLLTNPWKYLIEYCQVFDN